MASNRVADLTVDELRMLIRETVFDALEEIITRDVEDELEFSEDIAEYLRDYLKSRPAGEPAQKVMKELGLLDNE